MGNDSDGLRVSARDSRAGSPEFDSRPAWPSEMSVSDLGVYVHVFYVLLS